VTDEIRPLFEPGFAAGLVQALKRNFTGADVNDVIGIAGEAALSRHDLSGVDRLTRAGSPTETLIRVFLVGKNASPDELAAALQPLTVDDAVAAGLLRRNGADLAAAIDLRPYSESGGPDWWVVSDLGGDVRPGVLDAEHVLGIGPAATNLAQATIRRPVYRALDVGVGCGVQSLHLSRHAASVVATDVSHRALRMAATTAALNGLSWDLRHGSLLEPVQHDLYDLIVCNPPFIVGPGFTPDSGGFTYRDSGLAGDAVCRELIAGLPRLLAPGGTAQLLANWIITGKQSWQERLTEWLTGSGCDAWIWQREIAEPGEYVSLWLRDAGELPGSGAWQDRYDRWMSWFASSGVAGIGMGLVTLRRTDCEPTIVCEDVRQAAQEPVGAEIDAWFRRLDWLRRTGDEQLLAASLTAVPDLVLQTRSLLTATGWAPTLAEVRQSHGMRWEIEVDDVVAGLLAACSGQLPLGALLALVASSVSRSTGEVSAALLPVVRDLVQRGILEPAVLPDVPAKFAP
jgi:methylase of polypeptide subunit release factors